MLRKKVVLALFLTLVFCLMLTSCKASSKHDNYTPGDSMAPSIDPDYGYGSGNVELPEGNVPPSDDAQDALDQKIIRTVYMDAQAKEFDKAIGAIRTALKQSGGFEETFRTTNRTYGSTDYYARTAYMVLRIPAEKLDAFLNEIGGMIHVTSQNSNAENVTSEYYDIEARLNVLESERAVYEKMLANAKNTSEMLNIQDRLYNVISEIEAFKTRLRVLESQVSYSTVTLNLSEVVEYSQIKTPDDSFWSRISNAFVTSWRKFAINSQNFAVWFIGAFPTLLVLAIIGFSAGWIVLKIKRKKKKQEQHTPVSTQEIKENPEE